jgi:hypothetical protein
MTVRASQAMIELECFSTDEGIINVELTEPEGQPRWPVFTPAAIELGSAHPGAINKDTLIAANKSYPLHLTITWACRCALTTAALLSTLWRQKPQTAGDLSGLAIAPVRSAAFSAGGRGHPVPFHVAAFAQRRSRRVSQLSRAGGWSRHPHRVRLQASGHTLGGTRGPAPTSTPPGDISACGGHMLRG